MKKKITAEKKVKNADMKNYDLSKSIEENGDSDKKIKHYFQELESEILGPEFDVSVLDVETDVPEIDTTMPEINTDFPEVPEINIDIPNLVENTGSELPDIDIFIEE